MTQLGELRSASEQFRSRHASVVAISVDGLDRSRAVVDRLGLDFPILSDPDHTVMRSFGVEDEENGIAWPAIFVVDPSGRVRWRDLTNDYRVRPSAETVIKALDGAGTVSP